MTSGELAVPGHDDVTRLRPVGWGRYVEAVFLTVWLIGWTVGEALGLALLGALFFASLAAAFGVSLSWTRISMHGGVALFFLFALVWVTLWTVGGCAALTHLLRSVAGEDRVHASADGLHIERRAGPFRRRRLVPIATIRRLRQRLRDHALIADTASGIVIVTQFGTPADRASLLDALQQRLALPDEMQARRMERETTPHGWEVDTEGADTRLARPSRRARRIRAGITWGITGVVLLGWLAAARIDAYSTDAIVCAALAFLLGAGSIWLTWGRTDWLARHGRLTRRRRFLGWSGERSFEAASLEVTHTVDSDGDDRFALVVHTPVDRRTIAKDLYDAADLLSLGEWLAARTSFPFLRLSR